MRLERIEGYPEMVRARLAGLRLGDCIVRPHRVRPSPASEDLGVFGKFLLGTAGLFGSVSLVVGGIAIFRFLFSVIREAWMD